MKLHALQFRIVLCGVYVVCIYSVQHVMWYYIMMKHFASRKKSLRLCVNSTKLYHTWQIIVLLILNI